MCLALPMRITALDGLRATIAVEGLEQECSVMPVPAAGVGARGEFDFRAEARSDCAPLWGLGIEVEEEAIPVSPAVRSVCDLLGHVRSRWPTKARWCW